MGNIIKSLQPLPDKWHGLTDIEKDITTLFGFNSESTI